MIKIRLLLNLYDLVLMLPLKAGVTTAGLPQLPQVTLPLQDVALEQSIMRAVGLGENGMFANDNRQHDGREPSCFSQNPQI